MNPVAPAATPLLEWIYPARRVRAETPAEPADPLPDADPGESVLGS